MAPGQDDWRPSQSLIEVPIVHVSLSASLDECMLYVSGVKYVIVGKSGGLEGILTHKSSEWYCTNSFQDILQFGELILNKFSEFIMELNT